MQKDVKRLEDMTLKELWELFPIRLVDPAPGRWKKSFNNEKKKLAAVLKERALSINHIGSTAVGTIKAKDIVDIMVETAAGKMKECAALLRDNGYIIMSESEERISLNKGYTPEGYADEVFHIHLRNKGGADEIYFCAYLKERPEVAKRYEELKIELLEEYGKDRDGYTAAKGGFVKEITEKAKRKASDTDGKEEGNVQNR